MQQVRGASHRTRGWVVGRVAGAPVVVSPGWLVAAVALTVLFTPTVRSFAPDLGSSAYLVAGVFVLLLLLSVFLHELAHALVARRRGLVVRELAVTLLGGHTQFGAGAPTPGTSAVVAAVGPAVNVAIAAVAWWALQAVPGGGVLALVVAGLAVANGFVGVFNLIPALPLDGGRVLEAVVWRATGHRHRGTTVAAWAGRLLAVGVVAWAVGVPLLAGASPRIFTVAWSALIGAFLWSGAGQALQAARAERSVAGFSLAPLVRPAAFLPARGTVADLDVLDSGQEPSRYDLAAGSTSAAHDVVLLDPDGRAVGLVDRSATQGVPAEHRATTSLQAVSVALPVGADVDGALVGSAAVQAVARAARTAPVLVVRGVDGRPVGVLRTQDVIGALQERRTASGT